MNSKKIFNFILKYGVILIILISLLSVLWVGYLLLFGGGFGMSYEIPGNKLTETYLKIGDYKIGKQKRFYNICSSFSGCLDGEISGINKVNNDIYINESLKLNSMRY